MKRIQVRLGERSYPVFVGKGLLSQVGPIVKKSIESLSAVLVVTQKPIAERYGSLVAECLSSHGFKPSSFVIETKTSSEEAKSGEVLLKVLGKMSLMSSRNNSVALVALGGGVIGDLTGFAASIFRRGVPYFQIPTTLTAQVDSSIGGKTGVDLPEGKNLLGTVYQPRAVIADISTLHSLPARHWSDGFAEVIKYGIIRDPRLFETLEKSGLDGIKRSESHLEEVIRRCIHIKADVVARDEQDKRGIRAILNFGHTAGHAIESVSEYSGRYTHGEAVAIGMLVASDIALSMKVLKEDSLAERLEKCLLKFNLPVYFKHLPIDAVLKAMSYDKKSQNGKNRLVLPEKIGHVRLVADVPEKIIAQALSKRKR